MELHKEIAEGIANYMAALGYERSADAPLIREEKDTLTFRRSVPLSTEAWLKTGSIAMGRRVAAGIKRELAVSVLVWYCITRDNTIEVSILS